MLSARSVMGMGGWSRIPGREEAHTGGVSMRPELGGGPALMHVYARDTCDHGALGAGGMKTAAHAVAGMVEHTAAGGRKMCVL